MNIWLSIQAESFGIKVHKLIRFDAVRTITTTAKYTRVELSNGKVSYYDNKVYTVMVENLENY